MGPNRFERGSVWAQTGLSVEAKRSNHPKTSATEPATSHNGEDLHPTWVGSSAVNPPGPSTSKTQDPTQNRADRRGFAPPPQQGTPLQPSTLRVAQGHPGSLNTSCCQGHGPGPSTLRVARDTLDPKTAAPPSVWYSGPPFCTRLRRAFALLRYMQRGGRSTTPRIYCAAHSSPHSPLNGVAA